MMKRKDDRTGSGETVMPSKMFTIRAKLAILFAALFLLPFSVSAALWYYKSTKAIEENAIQSTEQLSLQIGRNLDSYFSDVKKVTIPLLTNPLVQQFIKLEPSDAYKQFSVIEQMKLDLFPNYIYGRSDIYGFTLLSAKGNYYSNTVMKERIDELGNLETGEDNYRIVGASVIDTTPVITVYRKIYDNSTYKNGGAIVLDLYLDPLSDITDTVRLGPGGVISIADAYGRYLYHPDRAKWGAPLPEAYFKRFEGQTGARFVADGEGGRTIVIANRSALTGLTLIAEVPLAGLIRKLTFMRSLTIALGCGMLLFAVVMIIGFSVSITKPVSQLMKLMKKVERGSLQVRAPARRDEFGLLNHGFNRMLEEIQRLIEIVHVAEMRQKEMAIKQRESLLQSLQSRINPHFLYNTLEAINAYAIVAKVKPISQMTVWLSQILRYSIGHPDKMVSLDEELDNVNTYFHIQRERFRSLQTEMRLAPEEAVKRVRILPLTVQPLVENAFAHGYEKQKRKPDYIGIFGNEEGDCYVLTVVDQGGGMPEELAQAYNEAFEGITDQDMLKPEPRSFERLGLWNVHSRLRLAFGERCGLRIVRSGPDGTAIEIRLPYDDENRDRGERDVHV